METCRIDDCERPIKIKKDQLCGLHYNRKWKHGDPLAWKRRVRPVCSVDGCAAPNRVRGMCGLHDARMRRYGSTERPERPTVCVIDACGAKVTAHGLCDRHYRRERRHPDAPTRRCGFCGSVLGEAINLSRRFCSVECKEGEHYARRQEKHRGQWLKRYGLTVASFDAMFASQGSRCAICGGADHRGRNGNVDHDHKTGKVRGILCSECNTGLGKFGDDPERLRRAALYLAP